MDAIEDNLSGAGMESVSLGQFQNAKGAFRGDGIECGEIS
jgi:hypothetical protein